MTWLMDNQRPLAVAAIAQTNKPAVYSRVDDEATILLQYPKAQGIIQASWNWPLSRKDLEVYGETGYAIATAATACACVFRGSAPRRRVSWPICRPPSAIPSVTSPAWCAAT